MTPPVADGPFGGASKGAGPGMHWRGGEAPPPLQGPQPTPGHCPPDGKCHPQWHL